MAEMRTADVDNLLSVLAALDDEDTIFALLEDLFTPREIKETSQRLAVARLLSQGKRALRQPPSPAYRNASLTGRGVMPPR